MGGGPVKTPRMNGHEPSPLSYSNGVDIPMEAEVVVNGVEVEGAPADDPIVYGMDSSFFSSYYNSFHFSERRTRTLLTGDRGAPGVNDA